MPMIEWSVACRTHPQERECGDGHLVKSFPTGMLLAVIDGVGHGEDAARTSALAARALADSNGGSLITLLRACHGRLQGTRGAVLSMAYFNWLDATMTWLGVGNVQGVLLHKEAHIIPGQESLLLRGGVLGDQLPRISASILAINPGDLLVLATDGIRSGFADNLNFNIPTQEVAESIMERNWRRSDDALVLVARYVHTSEAAPR